jgi:hypothetical protein
MSEIKRDAAADLAMCEAATPGPWVVDGENGVIWDGKGQIVVVLDANADPDNDDFIAESRTALPHWINRAVAAEAEVERLREALRSISTYEPPPGCEDIGNEVMNRIAKRALEKT